VIIENFAEGRGRRGNLGFPTKEGACGETLVSRNGFPCTA